MPHVSVNSGAGSYRSCSHNREVLSHVHRRLLCTTPDFTLDLFVESSCPTMSIFTACALPLSFESKPSSYNSKFSFQVYTLQRKLFVGVVLFFLDATCFHPPGCSISAFTAAQQPRTNQVSIGRMAHNVRLTFALSHQKRQQVFIGSKCSSAVAIIGNRYHPHDSVLCRLPEIHIAQCCIMETSDVSPILAEGHRHDLGISDFVFFSPKDNSGVLRPRNRNLGAVKRGIWLFLCLDTHLDTQKRTGTST